MKPSVILCPVDFSPPSRVAFQEACDLARDTGAKLVLVHVYDAFMPVMPEMPILPTDLMQQDLAQREQLLSALTVDARERGVHAVEREIVHGAPWDRIVSAARTWHCQLIVIGTHGRTGLRHVLIGSVAEKVTRHAPCSVLVVRAAETA